MGKITKLTKEQEATIPQFVKKWVDWALFTPARDDKTIEKNIHAIYADCGLQSPRVISAKGVKDFVTQVYSQVDSQVYSQVYSQVGSQVGSQVYYWADNIAFNDFFLQNNIIDCPQELKDSFYKYTDFISDIIYAYWGKDTVFVLTKPKVRKTERALHSDTEPALEWEAGDKLYYLNGVNFPEDLWKKVVSRNMSFSEIAAIQDIDQRTQAMRYCGEPNKMMEDIGAELLDGKTRKGNWLWKIPQDKGLFRIDAYFLTYQDTSTDRFYMKGVKPEIGAKGDADLAQAESHKFTIKQYRGELIES